MRSNNDYPSTLGLLFRRFLISQLKKAVRAFAAQLEAGLPRAADLCEIYFPASLGRGRPRVCTRYNCRARIIPPFLLLTL